MDKIDELLSFFSQYTKELLESNEKYKLIRLSRQLIVEGYGKKLILLLTKEGISFSRVYHEPEILLEIRKPGLYDTLLHKFLQIQSSKELAEFTKELYNLEKTLNQQVEEIIDKVVNEISKMPRIAIEKDKDDKPLKRELLYYSFSRLSRSSFLLTIDIYPYEFALTFEKRFAFLALNNYAVKKRVNIVFNLANGTVTMFRKSLEKSFEEVATYEISKELLEKISQNLLTLSIDVGSFFQHT